MGKEAHISNLFKDLRHLLDRQQLELNAIASENLLLNKKLETLEKLIEDEKK